MSPIARSATILIILLCASGGTKAAAAEQIRFGLPATDSDLDAAAQESLSCRARSMGMRRSLTNKPNGVVSNSYSCTVFGISDVNLNTTYTLRDGKLEEIEVRHFRPRVPDNCALFPEVLAQSQLESFYPQDGWVKVGAGVMQETKLKWAVFRHDKVYDLVWEADRETIMNSGCPLADFKERSTVYETFTQSRPRILR